MQSMAEALTTALPGETPAQKLVAMATRLGAAFDGSRWRFPSPRERRTLRRAARALGVRPPEALADQPDPAWTARVRAQELERRLALRERLIGRFRVACRDGVRQALLDGRGDAARRLVEADLEVTPETLAWLEGLPADLELFPVEVHLPPTVVAAAATAARRAVSLGLKARSKRAALAGEAVDLATPVSGVIPPAALVAEVTQALTPTVHRRAAIKRRLMDLWRAHRAGTVPAECPEVRHPEERWDQLAWLVFVGYALPPVFTDQRRWDARQALRDALVGTGLEVAQLRATLETARRDSREEARESAEEPVLTLPS